MTPEEVAVRTVSRWVAHQCLPPGISREDFLQEAHLAAWQALQEFEPRFGTTREGWATSKAMWRVRHLLRDASRLPRAVYYGRRKAEDCEAWPVSLQDVAGLPEAWLLEDVAASQDRWTGVLDRLDVEARLAAALPGEEWREELQAVRLCFLEGLTQTEAGRVMDRSQMHVSRLVQRALVRLREVWDLGTQD